jgi:ubiquitin-activating enzyme E1
VDAQCVFYEKALLESGTLGTKCNVQVVLPHLTASYADGPKDEAGDAIPMCTLRNFPSQIEHCIEWARARFTDLFATAATSAQTFSGNPDKWLKDMRAKTLEAGGGKGKVISAVAQEMGPVREMLHLLQRASSPDNCFAECVREAFNLFHRMFRDNIDSLIKTYPEGTKDSTGSAFWSGTKRFPQAARFEPGNVAHMDFVIATANLLAVNLGLQPAAQPLPANHPWRQPAHVAAILGKLPVPRPVQDKVDMSGGGEEDEAKVAAANKMEVDEDASVAQFAAVLADLERLKGEAAQTLVEPAEFEKDADWNFHIDFITAASNLRAWNYRLKPASRHQSKMIAGKIIPALATTTAAVTGLVMIEMIKALQLPGKKLEAFKDSSNSLGINGYFFSEPTLPEKAKDEYDHVEMSEVKCRPPGFTKWDKTDIRKGKLTLKGFLDAFHTATGLHCVALFHASANREGAQGHSKFLYEKNAWKKDLKQVYLDRLALPLEKLVYEVYGDDALPQGKSYVALDLSAEDDDGAPYKVPSAVYHFA